MVASVVRSHHWAPEVIGALFFDAEDYYGLQYWYDDVMEVNRELKELNK